MDIEEVGEMTDPLIACERPFEENTDVVVHFPRTWRARSTDCCDLIKSPKISFIIIIVVLNLCIWTPIIVGVIVRDGCHRPPWLILEDVNLRDMAVYQNTIDAPYQVRSEFSVNLTAWNPNKVPKCFTTFRSMTVSVDYKGHHILQQEVPLGFGLKPRESRMVMLDLRSEGYLVKKELAWLLDFELRRNWSAIELGFKFKSRVMRNDRKASWYTMMCSTMTTLFPHGNFTEVKFCRNPDKEEEKISNLIGD